VNQNFSSAPKFCHGGISLFEMISPIRQLFCFAVSQLFSEFESSIASGSHSASDLSPILDRLFSAFPLAPQATKAFLKQFLRCLFESNVSAMD
jgi:hypothetical protein